MRRLHPPSGLHDGLPFVINAQWSPEQALAVFLLLDDLRERVWAHYQLALQTQLRKQRVTRYAVTPTDPPF